MALTQIDLYNLRTVTISSHAADSNLGWDVSGTTEIRHLQAGYSSTYSGRMSRFEFNIPTSIIEPLGDMIITVPLMGNSWPANIRYLILEGHDKTPNDLYNNRMGYLPHNNTDSIFYTDIELTDNITGTDTVIGASTTIYAKIDISGLSKGQDYTLVFLENQDNLSANGYINGVEDVYTSDKTTKYLAYLSASKGSAVNLVINGELIQGQAYVWNGSEYKPGIAYVKTNNGYKTL